MSVNTTINQVSYGINNPLQKGAPRPIIAQRAPTVNDFNAELGTLWVYPAGAAAWILVANTGGSANWLSL